MGAIQVLEDEELGLNLQEALAELIKPGLVLLSVATYPDGKNPYSGRDMGYRVAVNMAREEDLRGAPRFDAIVRGTGPTIVGAIADAQASF